MDSFVIYITLGYFRNSGSQRSSLILSEIVFALGDVLSYINNRAFEQVGEYVEKDYSHATPGTSSKNDLAGRNSITAFNPDKILGGLESVELLAESLAEMYSLKSGSDTLKWVVVSAIQFFKYAFSTFDMMTINISKFIVIHCSSFNSIYFDFE